ncbi:unnamed protein product [Lota lota]
MNIVRTLQSSVKHPQPGDPLERETKSIWHILKGKVGTVSSEVQALWRSHQLWPDTLHGESPLGPSLPPPPTPPVCHITSHWRVGMEMEPGLFHNVYLRLRLLRAPAGLGRRSSVEQGLIGTTELLQCR